MGSGLANKQQGELILFVKPTPLPVDEAKMKEELPKFTDNLRQQQSQVAFDRWLGAQLAKSARARPPVGASTCGRTAGVNGGTTWLTRVIVVAMSEVSPFLSASARFGWARSSPPSKTQIFLRANSAVNWGSASRTTPRGWSKPTGTTMS